MKTKLQTLTRSLISTYYNNPANHLKLLAITGQNAKTRTANYTNQILKQANFKTSLLTNTHQEIAGKSKKLQKPPTFKNLQKFLYDSALEGVDYTIVAVNDDLLSKNLPLFIAIQTSERTSIVLDKNPHFLVVNADIDHQTTIEPKTAKFLHGAHQDADLKILSSKLYTKGAEATAIHVHTKTKYEFATLITGNESIPAMSAAVATAILLSINPDDIFEGIASVTEEIVVEYPNE
jgi:UDP-N-acetylmuramyl tripeptide synthase